MQLFKFRNVNASSIRTVMVSDVPNIADFDNDSPFVIKRKRSEMPVPQADAMNEYMMNHESHSDRRGSADSEKLFWQSWQEIDVNKTNISSDLESKGDVKQETVVDPDVQLLEAEEAFDANGGMAMRSSQSVAKTKSDVASTCAISDDGTTDSVGVNSCSEVNMRKHSSDSVNASRNRDSPNLADDVSSTAEVATHPLPCRYGRGGECVNGLMCPPMLKPKSATAVSASDLSEASAIASIACGSGNFAMSFSKAACAQDSTATAQANVEPDKYLIFTTGNETFTPHQIGIKRIRHADALGKMGKQAEQR